MIDDYPYFEPWQEEVLNKFVGRGMLQITGRNAKPWAAAAMQRLMDDLVNRPIEDLRCSEGTVFGKRYLTVEPIGGNWLAMETWCTETFGESSKVWDAFKESDILGRWYMNDRKFWFLNEEDLTMFLLKWR